MNLRAFAVLLPASIAVNQGTQSVPVSTLSSPNAILKTPFSKVAAVVELTDGRVLIADVVENSIVVADLMTNQITPVGNKGKGPDQYTSVGALVSLGKDSSLVVDPAQRRWLLVHGDRIVKTVPPDNPGLLSSQGILRGASDRGMILTIRNFTRPSGTGSTVSGDSMSALLVSLQTGETVVAARLQNAPERYYTNSDKSGVRRVSQYRHPLAIGEEAHLFSDGWLAVVRLNPYRVDWRRPNGKWLYGPPLPTKSIILDDRAKRAFMERMAVEEGRPVQPPTALSDWPRNLPPFAQGSLLSAPDGTLLVRHEKLMTTAETKYDIVDRNGRLKGQLSLPSNSRVIGFGKKVVFVLVADRDGLEQLQRHAWS